MRYYLLPDIFGAGPHTAALAAHLPVDCQVICPYDFSAPDFANETDAYEYFMGTVGLSKYCEGIRSAINSNDSPVSLLGFSVGASAAWLISAEDEYQRVSGSLGFYGNQIRHHCQMQPRTPFTLVMPCEEPHFDVAKLENELAQKHGVRVVRTPWRHGYMNPLSAGFDPQGYRSSLSKLGMLQNGMPFSDFR